MARLPHMMQFIANEISAARLSLDDGKIIQADRRLNDLIQYITFTAENEERMKKKK